jgi:hypothetical protein
LYIIPVINPMNKASLALAFLRIKKRGINAIHAIAPTPCFGNEKKRRIPDVIAKKKVLLLKLCVLNFSQ